MGGMGGQASELWQVSDADLLQAIADLEVEMRQQYSAMLGLISEMDTRGAAGNLGYSNTKAILVQKLRITLTEATHRVDHARDLHPTTTPTGSVGTRSSGADSTANQPTCSTNS
jgi:hypothetical protein